MRSVEVRGAAFLCALVALGGLLCGCESAAQGPMRISTDGRNYLFSWCGSPVSVDAELTVSERDGSDPWLVVLATPVSAGSWDAGSTWSTDPSHWENATKASPAAQAPGSRVTILLSAGEQTSSARFKLPDEGLAAGQWLEPDGSTNREACGD